MRDNERIGDNDTLKSDGVTRGENDGRGKGVDGW
jgi:hypothetical protein